MKTFISKINVHTQANGNCKLCGITGKQTFIAKNGRRKGEKFVDLGFYYKCFEENSWFRGDDDYIGTYCKNCFKLKPWEGLK